MILREVKFEDYKKIRNLVIKNSLNIYNYKNWEKIWKKNPYLQNKKIKWKKGWVIEHNNKIVGHLSSIPTEYYLNKKRYIGSIISCWVVDVRYRTESIRLIQEFHLQKYVDFFIATTSNLKTANTLKAFKWSEVPTKDYNDKLNIILNFKNVYNSYFNKKNFLYKIVLKLIFVFFNNFFKKKIDFWKKFKIKNKFEIYKSYNNKFDEFWSNINTKSKNKFLFNRSSKWMNWHFYPYLNKKNFFVIVKKNKSKITGYAICLIKYDRVTKLKKTTLVDILAMNNNKKVYFDLILYSLKEAYKLRSDILQMVGFNNEKRKQMLKLKPIITKNKFTPYLYKCINPKLKKLLIKKKYWEACSIDGDSIY